MSDFTWPVILIVNAVLVIVVGVFVLWKSHRDRKSGYPTNDERTNKIRGQAAIGTYWINLVFMVSLALFIIFGTEFLDLPDLDAGWAIIAIMLVSGISNALLSWYYSRKATYNADKNQRTASKTRPYPRRFGKDGWSTQRNHTIPGERKIQSIVKACT